MQLNTLAATVLVACMATAAPLEKRQDSGCAEYTFLFACGTTERGLGTVGTPLSQGLEQALGSVNTVATNYPASIGGNAQAGGSGGPQMASDAKAALSKCPNTKLIIGGYSQGAMVATNAVSAQGLPADKVVAALLFGNPFQNRGGGKIGSIPTLSQCNNGDGVCETGGFAITPAHLTYSSDGSVQKAVQFAQQNAGGGGNGGSGGGATPTEPDAPGATPSAGSGSGGSGSGRPSFPGLGGSGSGGSGGLPSFGGGSGGLPSFGGGSGGLPSFGGGSGGSGGLPSFPGLGGSGSGGSGGLPSFGGGSGGLPSFGGGSGGLPSFGSGGSSGGGLGSFFGKGSSGGGSLPSFGGLGGSGGGSGLGGLGSLGKSSSGLGGGLGSFGKMFGGK